MVKAASYSRFVMPILLLGVLVGIGLGWLTAGHSVNAEDGVENELPSV